MHSFSALCGRFLTVALLTAITFAARDALEVQAASTSINIVEPTDNPDDYKFEQTSVTVTAGDTVTWVNQGLDTHSVTADGNIFDSKDIDAGKSWTYTFATPGTFTYYCDPHPWMTGTVIVEPAA
jgi:plastocyanin